MRSNKIGSQKLVTGKLSTKKLVTSVGSGAIPPGVCPMLLPAILTAGQLGLVDATVTKNFQTFQLVSTEAAANGQAIYQSEVLYKTNGEKAHYEIELSNASALDYAGIFAFGLGLFGGTFGFNMAPADNVNGVLIDALTSTELINPWATQNPLIFQLRIDGIAGTIVLIGPDGSVVWTLSGPEYTQFLTNFPMYYFFGGQSPQGVGETLDFIVNAGRTPFFHPVPVDSKAFCELDTQNASYLQFNFFPSDGTFGTDPDGRTVFIENDGVEPSQWTGSMGYAALTVPVAYDWNVYEHEITQLDAGTLDDYWRMGFVGFISTQGGHVFEQNFNGGTYSLETYYSLGNLTKTQCFNNVNLAIGDSMALVVNGRRESEGPLLVRPFYDIGGETCLFDPIEVPPSGNGEDYVPNCQLKSQSDNPIGNVARVRFNGEDGDYASTYVDTFKDIQGAPITGSIPEVRETWFENRTVYTAGGTLPTITNSNTRLTVANVSGSNMTAQTHSRTLANLNDGQVVAAISLNTLVVANEYEFIFKGLNTDAATSQFGIEFNGADLVMTSDNNGVVEPPQVIQAGHTVTAGDEWGIQYDPDNSRARGILVRGVSTFVSGWIDVDTVFSGTVYMPRAFTGTVADSETCVIDCEYKVANMSAEMRTAAAGANDLEGNAA